jgi:hypothetical protein
MSGRPPGSASRSRLLGRRGVPTAAPAGPPASMVPPRGLTPAGREVWRREVPRVPGGLRITDVTSFTNMIRIQTLTERWLAQAEAVQAGDKIPQALWAAAKLARLVAELRKPFGLSPTDRQRLHLEPEEPDDDYAKFRRENPAP